MQQQRITSSVPDHTDETATATNMVRVGGRSPRGERLVGEVPQGYWTTLTFVAALRVNKITAPVRD